MNDSPISNLNNTDSDGVEPLRNNLQSTETQRPFSDGSDDSQNLDEDADTNANTNTANTFFESNQVEDEPASEVFSIDTAPPSFGAAPVGIAAFSFHEPTDLKWDPSSQSDDNVSSPKKDGSDDSVNEFMSPPTRSEPRVHRKGRESYGNVVSEMSFFEKFGNQDQTDDAEYTTDPSPKNDGVDDITPEKQPPQTSILSDSSSDAFMTLPDKTKKVHQKGKESDGNMVSETSFFKKFGSEEPPPVHSMTSSPVRSIDSSSIRSTDISPLRSVESAPVRSTTAAPDSKISTLISPQEARSIPSHRQKQASVGFAISELSFSQKFGRADDDDPPPVLTVTEDEPKEIGLDLEEASTSTISGNNENDEVVLQQDKIIQQLRLELQQARRTIQEQRVEIQRSKDSKIRLVQECCNEITRLKEDLGNIGKHQKTSGDLGDDSIFSEISELSPRTPRF